MCSASGRLFWTLYPFMLRTQAWCCRLDGTMTLKKRKEEVAKFQSDESVTIFLLSMHAAGTGLNLTEANNVILADCWYA